ncbi:MAG: Phosphoserine phosphatase 1 [Actinomycetota bacterium]|jgi:probable phosphoglycerate mutase
MDRFIVYADGASRGNPGPAAYGTLVLNHAEEVVAELAGYLDVATNNFAEYYGLITGLEFLQSIPTASFIEIRMDSKLVVEQMTGKWKVKHPDMRALALTARDLLQPFTGTFTWIPREQNSRADALANEALDKASLGILDPIVRRYDS